MNMTMNSSRLSLSLKQALAVASAVALFPLLTLPACANTGNTNTHLKLVSANAKLITRLNTKNAKQGERIMAKLTSNVKSANSIDLPKGTVLIGKVEHVQTSKDKGPSKLSVLFDQAKLRNGHLIPVKATLLGAYPSSSWNSYNFTGVGGPYTGTNSHYIPYDQRVDQESGTLSHVAMHSAVQSPVSGVFTSKNRNFKLNSGTELQFAIAPMGMSKTS